MYVLSRPPSPCSLPVYFSSYLWENQYFQICTQRLIISKRNDQRLCVCVGVCGILFLDCFVFCVLWCFAYIGKREKKKIKQLVFSLKKNNKNGIEKSCYYWQAYFSQKHLEAQDYLFMLQLIIKRKTHVVSASKPYTCLPASLLSTMPAWNVSKHLHYHLSLGLSTWP